MRLPIATDLKTRTGAPDKDARLKNCYVESKGPVNDPNNPPQTAVRKRPIAQGGVSVGTGTAQGGIGFYIGSTPYFIGFWGDILYNYIGNGTNWNSGTTYPQGSMVSYNFVNYWSVDDSSTTPTPNVNNNPTTTPSRWRSTPTYCVSPVIPAPVVTGISQTYQETTNVPADVTLSDVLIGYYCIGQLRKKVVVHYTIDAGVSGYKISVSGYSNQAGVTPTLNVTGSYISVGITLAEAQASAKVKALAVYPVTAYLNPPHPDPFTIDTVNSTYASGVYSYGGVPGQAILYGATSPIITNPTIYTLTATTTESYYLI